MIAIAVLAAWSAVVLVVVGLCFAARRGDACAAGEGSSRLPGTGRGEWEPVTLPGAPADAGVVLPQHAGVGTRPAEVARAA
jgi:hypothetical protein